MAGITKKELQKAIVEIIQFLDENNIDPTELGNNNMKHLKSRDEFVYDNKLDEIIDRLINRKYREYFIETLVFEKKVPDKIEEELLLEWNQYQKIPKTNLNYRYDVGNTNTKTQDHIHVFSKENQLYAINKDGTKHDGSKAQLGNKEIKFLQSKGFTPPVDGILEWYTLNKAIDYEAVDVELLYS
jgi:hypothetical protein